MTLQEVYQFFGSPYAACKAIGITPGASTYWNEKGYIPFRTQKYIESITKGKLIADKVRKAKSIKDGVPSIFKYQDKKHGLCEVIFIHFTKGTEPKIIYISPQNGKKVTVFGAKNLVIKK